MLSILQLPQSKNPDVSSSETGLETITKHGVESGNCRTAHRMQTRDNSYQCWEGHLRGLSLLAVEGEAVGGAAKSSHHWVVNDDHNSAALWTEEPHVRNKVLVSAEIRVPCGCLIWKPQLANERMGTGCMRGVFTDFSGSLGAAFC